jgi:hypothetical protein
MVIVKVKIQFDYVNSLGTVDIYLGVSSFWNQETNSCMAMSTWTGSPYWIWDTNEPIDVNFGYKIYNLDQKI